MYIEGSLFKAINRCLNVNSKIALFVIDEENNAAPGETSNTPGLVVYGSKKTEDSNTTAFQQRLLLFMQIMGCTVFSINININLPVSYSGPDLTRSAIKGLYIRPPLLLRKNLINAFDGTLLNLELYTQGITHLVVMGYHANVCVSTTIGIITALVANYAPGSALYYQNTGPGALHYQYTVMTCNQILHGAPATWSHDIVPDFLGKLEFYSSF